MTFISVYTFVDVLVVFLLLLLSLFLTQLRVGNRVSHRILSAFLLCLALSYMDGVFLSFGYRFHYSYPHMVYLTMSFDFLVGPLLYLYVLSRTQPDFKFLPRHGLHGLMFLGHFFLLFFRYHLKSLEEKRSLLETYQVFSHGEIIALTTVSNLHYLAYMIATVYVLRRYQQAIKNVYSNVHRKNLNWLLLISCGLLLAGLMRFSNNLLWLQVPHSAFLQYVDLKLIAITCVFLFACTVMYKSLQQPEVLRIPADCEDPSTVLEKHIGHGAGSPEKYKTTLLQPDKKSSYLERLNTYMQDQKPYLNAELTLPELAGTLDIPSHHLSQIINSEYNRNFHDFVNGYRLQEAARLLKDPAYSDKYITQIMYDSGFNSKSVFNTLFKKEFGQTPSIFRKNAESAFAASPLT